MDKSRCIEQIGAHPYTCPMAGGFSLSVDPWIYMARFGDDGTWVERFEEKEHRSPAEEAKLAPAELERLLARRNSFPELPLVNYTTQYGMGCFEGLKGFPQADGGLKLFRPADNGRRMKVSMEGLYMPPFPVDRFLSAVRGVASRNRAAGFCPVFDPAWPADNFASAGAMYLRPFTYSEGGIGVGISAHPWVIVVATTVSSYFRPGASKATTTPRVRAHPGGTGWIKCDANYVTSALAKREAEAAGFMEAVFLDAREQAYLEEGSSCNIFAVLKDGTLLTPTLEDTILPGITRSSVLELAKEAGIKTVERRVAVDEVLSEGRELFATGTAAGVTYFESLTHKGRTVCFGNGTMGEVAAHLLTNLKGIQYGILPDTRGWMVDAA